RLQSRLVFVETPFHQLSPHTGHGDSCTPDLLAAHQAAGHSPGPTIRLGRKGRCPGRTPATNFRPDRSAERFLFRNAYARVTPRTASGLPSHKKFRALCNGIKPPEESVWK